MPMIPAWLNRAAFQRQVREEFLAHLRVHAPHWRGRYDQEEGLLLLADTRSTGEDGEPLDIKLNPSKLYGGAAGKFGISGRRKVYDFWLNQLEQISADTSDSLSLETHASRILPRLVEADFVTNIERQTEIPQRGWGWTGLRIVYVLDRPDSVAYIIRSMAEELGLNDSQLHDLALENLRKIFDPAPILNAVNEQQPAVLNFPDGHGAVRALLIGEHLQENQACGVLLPDRDTLVVMPPPNDNDWKPLAQWVSSLTDPLLDRPLKITSHGVELPS